MNGRHRHWVRRASRGYATNRHASAIWNHPMSSISFIKQNWHWPHAVFIHLPLIFVVAQVAQPCPTLCNPMDCCMPGLPVHHHHLEFAQVHVRCWATREAQGTVQERKERLRTRKCLKLPPKFFHNCLPATVSFLEWKKHFFISFQDGSGLICSSLAQKMYKAEKQVKSTLSPTT